MICGLISHPFFILAKASPVFELLGRYGVNQIKLSWANRKQLLCSCSLIYRLNGSDRQWRTKMPVHLRMQSLAHIQTYPYTHVHTCAHACPHAHNGHICPRACVPKHPILAQSSLGGVIYAPNSEMYFKCGLVRQK